MGARRHDQARLVGTVHVNVLLTLSNVYADFYQVPRRTRRAGVLPNLVVASRCQRPQLHCLISASATILLRIIAHVSSWRDLRTEYLDRCSRASVCIIARLIISCFQLSPSTWGNGPTSANPPSQSYAGNHKRSKYRVWCLAPRHIKCEACHHADVKNVWGMMWMLPFLS